MKAMGFLKCCFSGDTGLTSEQSFSEDITPCEAASPIQAEKPQSTSLQVGQSAVTHHSSASAPVRSQGDPALQQALQTALGALDTEGFEARAAQVVRTVLEHLGPSALVRVYGLTSDEGESQAQYAVQLAASAGRAVAGLRWEEDSLPGRSFGLSPACRAPSGLHSVPPSLAFSGVRRDDPSRLLLERALSTRKPATFHLANISRARGDFPMTAAAGSLPRDCAADVGVIRCPGPLMFAAVPLSYGKHVMGALWIAVADSDAPDGDPHWDDSATASRSQAARSHALLASETALEQIGMSASVALALAAAGDFDYMAWLSACLRRLAICATLHTLVAGVCSAVSTHVRLRFHADAAVQSALVPEHDSHVAFMLCPETQAQPVASGGGGGLSQLASFVRAAGIQHALPDATQNERPKSAIIAKPNRVPVRRVASQLALLPGSSPARDKGGAVAHTTGGLQAGARVSTLRESSFRDDRECVDACAPSRAVRSPAATSLTSAPLLRMSAKAFHMSHTLLSRLVLSARAQQPPAQVPTGIVVVDTARHVADVRQPSRDVCMLIGAKNAVGGSLWQPPSCRNVGGRTSMELSTGSRAGASSLLLLAMEVADGGCMLGLYVAFPTLMPQPLLAAARDSCEQLLRQVLVGLVRHKLNTAELGPDLDTLRAGVPGSYVSVSRVRDHVDQLQLPVALARRSPQPRPAGESLAHAQDLDVNLTRRIAVWSAGPSGSGVETPRVTPQNGGAPSLPPASPQAQADMDSFTGDPGALSHRAERLMGGLHWEDARARVGVPPLPAAKLLLARGSWAHQGNSLAGGESVGGFVSGGGGSNLATPGDSGKACTATQLSVSTQGVVGMRIPSFASGLPSCVGVGSQAASSTVMLDSNADPVEPRFTQAALMTVHGVDDTFGMRGMMGALVESIMTTLRASAAQLADESMGGPEVGFRAVEGLEDLHLADVLGHGGSGVVLRGTLGTVPVAVKLMEMPDADYDALSTEVGLARATAGNSGSRERCGERMGSLTDEPLVKSLASMAASGAIPRAAESQAKEHELQGREQQNKQQQLQHERQTRQEQQQDPDNGGLRLGDGRGRQQTESQQMRARRTMLRNATELAVMRLVSHVCIVQTFAVYDNVIMERPPHAVDCFMLRRLDPKNPETGGSPICTAIVQELCDRGSLADVLESRSFPAFLPPRGQGAAGTRGGHGTRVEVDMKGVYLTLLEIALALRHLHSRRLVHRDVKPANILLKSSPGDPRGWTCKLADFGFALVLDQQDKCSDGKEEATKLSSPCSHVSNNLGSVSGRTWYTVQAQASGTVTHMAPEAVMKNSRIDASVDIYALGIIFWELTCGRGQRPFRHLDPAAIPSAVVAGIRPTFTGEVPAAYRKMAQACWAQEPHRRPRAADVVAFIKAQLATTATQ